MNKSQAIRDYLKANKKAKAQEVVDALKKQGIETTVNYVTNLKSKSKARRRKVKEVVENVVAEGGVGIPEIKAAFAFLKATGSVAVAKQALAAAVRSRRSCSERNMPTPGERRSAPGTSVRQQRPPWVRSALISPRCPMHCWRHWTIMTNVKKAVTSALKKAL